MPLKTDTIEEPNLNLTPMIDIVFLLIIFFMVGTRFTEAEREFDIELPTVTDAQPLTTMPDEIVVSVTNDGRYLLRDEERTLEELKSALTAARENFADQAVLIRGDGQGPYQYVMDVLAVCHSAKITNVSLANRLQQDRGARVQSP
jgi:biopolymer transport protein ExbD